jgi:hypothetical protein
LGFFFLSSFPSFFSPTSLFVAVKKEEVVAAAAAVVVDSVVARLCVVGCFVCPLFCGFLFLVGLGRASLI